MARISEYLYKSLVPVFFFLNKTKLKPEFYLLFTLKFVNNHTLFILNVIFK